MAEPNLTSVQASDDARQRIIDAAKTEHDAECSCDPKYLMSCGKMAAAVLRQAGKARVRPAGDNWSTRLSDGRRLSLEVVGLTGRLRLSVSTQHAATPLQLYLDVAEARALAAAVRFLAPAEFDQGDSTLPSIVPVEA